MSKNVAVFVDVANIFYAAKAAGIDIDYVTLLKSATAGRDFVRAYAYTGLDPENENQRQFHSFLARNGYKVISKDIRKYGDGRIKANLDIELVVDMMKTARNLDIAVVVSGDGDFAPAIRAVQEQGVRVEVISFRGNTSSDLIEVADLFTDIAQIARVEKSSARSGRRVAAEGDLSMTEVPEKETEGAPRRRRGRSRDERLPEVAAASTVGQPSNLIVLPGERLSRAPEGEEELEAATTAEVGEDSDLGEYAAQSGNGREAALADGQRRRRRRGGRGRGRGRGRDGELLPAEVGDELAPATAGAGADIDEDEEFEELAPTQPPHHAFGSVWDSQIGVPSASSTPTAGPAGSGDFDEDEDLDEPEVPEYLLAERRQRGQRPTGRPGARAPRGRSAYQAALDRERFGRGAAPQQQPTFGGGSRPDRGRDRDRSRGGRPQQSRPVDRAPRSDVRPTSFEPRSTEPWSEVPPELEELLRAELARKGAAPGQRFNGDAATAMTPAADVASAMDSSAVMAQSEAPATAAKPTRARRTTKSRTSRTASASPATAEGQAPSAAADATASETPKPKTTRSTRTTVKAPARARTTKTAKTATTAATGTEAAAAEPKKPATRRRTTKASAATAEEG